MMEDYAVKCERVTKRYDRKHALNEFSALIPRGGVVGILGPNGSGKSTLFRLLTGLIRAEQGEITILGKSPGWQTNREIAYLPDRARWYPDHTVNHAFTWAENFLPGFERSSAETLAKFMKVDLSMQAVGMSRGQEARLMLILCIARQVPLVILDEPFSGIDAISREQIIHSLIDYLSERDHTVLISTHEVYEAESLFDHVICMNEGKVVLSGGADEIRAKYGSINSTLKQLFW